MIKIFMYPIATSSTVLIGLEEMGIQYEAVQPKFEENDPLTRELEKLNPLVTVPTCLLENGKVLTQVAAILEYLADLHPAAKLLPAPGTFERADVMRWLVFSVSDLHSGLIPLFDIKFGRLNGEETKMEVRDLAIKKTEPRLKHLNNCLEGKKFITGDQITIADFDLFLNLWWVKSLNIPTDHYRHLNSYYERIGSRPAVQRAAKVAGLV